MKLQDILSPHFRKPRKPLTPLIQVASDSDFCQDVVAKGLLTIDQMCHASECYRLGKSKSGRCIFWMIDELGIVRDGHLGGTWVSQLLKAREPKFLQSWHPTHCLFGLHLLSHTEITENTEIKSVSSVKSVVENMPIAIVESEASAVVLSELFPESLWMAYVSTPHLAPDLLAPLEGCIVTIYPRTDPTLSTYLFFQEYAEQVRRHYDIHLSVSSLLEDHATPSQKQRKIDLVDFLFGDQ